MAAWQSLCRVVTKRLYLIAVTSAWASVKKYAVESSGGVSAAQARAILRANASDSAASPAVTAVRVAR